MAGPDGGAEDQNAAEAEVEVRRILIKQTASTAEYPKSLYANATGHARSLTIAAYHCDMAARLITRTLVVVAQRTPFANTTSGVPAPNNSHALWLSFLSWTRVSYRGTAAVRTCWITARHWRISAEADKGKCLSTLSLRTVLGRGMGMGFCYIAVGHV